MGIKRIVDTSFWTDGKVDDFSPEDKYFMLYLLTNPFSKQLGIYEISIKQAAFQMGYSVDAFNVLLDRFESKYNIIRFSRETSEIAILNFLKHSVMKGGKPVEDCIKRDMATVKNKRLIDFVFSHLHGKDGLNATVKNIVDEYIKQNDIHNDNDNDNDRTQDVSYDESSPDSSTAPPKPKKNKPIKQQYGEYGKVLLSDAEYERLADDYGYDLTDKAVKFLDEYIAEKGYKSKSHNLAIRRWVIDAVKEKEAVAAKTNQNAKPRHGNFDSQEAFERAVMRSYEEKPQPKTAADDPYVRERMEALKEKIERGANDEKKM